MTNTRPLPRDGATILAALLILIVQSAAQTSPPTLSTLYAFKGTPDGAGPLGIIHSGGLMYGTTQSGGAMGYGAVYSLTPPAFHGGSWTEAVIYSFTGGPAYPSAVVIGPGGVLYGTTGSGGVAGLGTVFSLTPPSSVGGTWTVSVLHSFTGGSDGDSPQAALTIGAGGVLYGTTYYGGTSIRGTVFSVAPPADPGGSWAESVLHSFAGASRGAYPMGAMALGRSGVLYGTTSYGGTGSCLGPIAGGCGTIFALAPPSSQGGAWTGAVLHSFTGVDGRRPIAGVVMGNDGVLYGTTDIGGNPPGFGTVFSLTPPSSPGASWIEAVIHGFTGGTSPRDPWAGVVIGGGGILYGTTWEGGSSGSGTVFSLAPPSSPGAIWTLSVLHSFTGGSDGGNPTASVVIGDGVLYGTAGNGADSNSGTVFELKP